MKRIMILLLVLAVGAFYFLWQRKASDQPFSQPTAQAKKEKPPAAAARGPSSLPPAAGVPVTEAHAVLANLQRESTEQWQIERSNDFGAPRTIVSGAWTVNGNDAKEMAAEFVNKFSQGLFSVAPHQLELHREVVTDRTKIIYLEVIDGRKVFGASLGLIFDNGKLVRIQNDLTPANLPRVETKVTFAQAKAQMEKMRNFKTGSGAIVLNGGEVSPEMVYYLHQGKLITAFHMFIETPTPTGSRRMEVLLDGDHQHLILARDVQIQ